MIVNYEKKWIYIGPPKTGSTTISFLLTDGNYNPNKDSFTLEYKKNFFGISENGQHTPWPPNKLDDKYVNYFVFISVRNPFSRIVSLWKHFCYGKNFNEEKKTNISLYEFIVLILENKLNNNDGFFKYTITEWVYNYNAYIKQENLENDLKKLNFHNHDFIMPTINKNKKNNIYWKNFHDKNTIDLTIKWAKKDFENFNYAERIDV